MKRIFTARTLPGLGSGYPWGMATDPQAPDTPAELEKRSWVEVAKRTVKEFQKDNLTDWAAALTYYAVLAIFPALIVIVSLIGLIGESATQPLIENLGEVAPGPAQEIFTSAIEDLQKSQGAAGVLATGGLAGEAGNLIGVGDSADDLEHRQVAGAGRARQPAVRDPLLGRAERAAAGLPLDQPRRDLRGAGVGRGVAGVRVLRRQLRVV